MIATKWGDGTPRQSGVDSYVKHNLTSLLEEEMMLWAKHRMLEKDQHASPSVKKDAYHGAMKLSCV